MEIEIPLHGSRPPKRPPKRRFRPTKRAQARAREAAEQARNRRRVAGAGTSRVTDQKDSSTAHVAKEGPTMPTPKRQQSLPNFPPVETTVVKGACNFSFLADYFLIHFLIFHD